MKRDLPAASAKVHDLLIVGGGIYGACAAWEAARRGLSVCLLERGDFGGATSSQSLRIIHGGLRYLQHLDFRRMRRSVAERRTWLRIAPHLVEPLGCLLPVYGHGLRGREALAAALRVSDAVSYDRNRALPEARRIPSSRMLTRAEVLATCPWLASDGIRGGARWHDAQVWSTERLLVGVLQSASRSGATLANHVDVLALRREGERVVGARARDTLTGHELNVSARVVLNAAGPWVDRVLTSVERANRRTLFRPSKGMNLVVRRSFADLAVGIPEGAPPTGDGNPSRRSVSGTLFLVPWRGVALIGTKHLRWSGDADRFSVDARDIERLLADVNGACPGARLSASDVIAVQAGMLPEADGAREGAVTLESQSRIVDHAEQDGIEGLVTMVGVKWTTARQVAAEAIGLIARKLGRTDARRAPEPVPVFGGGGEARGYAAALAADRPGRLTQQSAECLARCFGSEAAHVADLVRSDPELARPVHPGTAVIAAQVVHAVAEEMAVHLDDVVLRRAELWLEAPRENGFLERCAVLAAPHLGWDRSRIAAEVDRAAAALERIRPALSQRQAS